MHYNVDTKTLKKDREIAKANFETKIANAEHLSKIASANFNKAVAKKKEKAELAMNVPNEAAEKEAVCKKMLLSIQRLQQVPHKKRVSEDFKMLCKRHLKCEIQMDINDEAREMIHFKDVCVDRTD